MPGAEIAQYGIATFAIAGLVFVVSRIFDKKQNNNLAEVIKNNTKALEQVLLSSSNSVISYASGSKIDELLERQGSRREEGMYKKHTAYGTTIHTFEFNPEVYKWTIEIGKSDSLKPLRKLLLMRTIA